MKTFLKDNTYVWIWIVFATLIELLSITFTDCKPYLSSPIYALILLLLCTLVLFIIPNRIAKLVIIFMLAIGQIIICVGFVYLYESNGTFFDYSMINMRDDAFGTIEDWSFNWTHLSICIILCAILLGVMIALEIYFRKKHSSKFKAKKSFFISLSIVITLILICFTVVPIYDGIIKGQNSYQNMLFNQKSSKYQTKGITANAIYEVISGNFANKVHYDDLTPVNYALSNENENLYLKTTEFNGISENNNLIMIMVESFDWYPLTLYYDAETINEIYPNLTKFMGESIVLNNYHTREKTDTSENNALLGSNPTGKYVNYDFCDNEYPYSLVNMFKNKYTDTVANAFHQNRGKVYNRKTLFKQYGFDYFYDIDDMKAYGVVNTYDEDASTKGERTKDSEAMLHMVETMFPTDQQFLTYWLTFSMHGYYVERENLGNFIYTDQHDIEYAGGYYGYFDNMGVFPKSDITKANYLRTYAAALKDFDVAVGIMMNYLEEKNLLDNTTIFMYSDHNTYYNNLAKYGKGIDDTYNSELYRIPAMIYDKKLYNAYKTSAGEDAMQIVYGTDQNDNYKCLTVSKFTNNIDFIPTIFDMFNIKGYNDLYPGSSIFIEDVESIIYSRAYGIFVTDKLVCYSANKLLYTVDGFTKQDKQNFILRAEEHLRIKEITDLVFYSNYFATHQYIYPTYS